MEGEVCVRRQQGPKAFFLSSLGQGYHHYTCFLWSSQIRDTTGSVGPFCKEDIHSICCSAILHILLPLPKDMATEFGVDIFFKITNLFFGLVY